MKSSFPRMNNFDLLRLFAAFQVVLLHAIEHLGPHTAAFEHLAGILKKFPGVPIFFFTSGFLISMSYARSPRSSVFFRNRSLRLFPALWVCLFLSIFLVWSLGYPIFQADHMKSLFIWIFTQTTMFQFWNPEFLRGFGLGVLNGSLWTISVEIQFYILTPLLALLLSRKCTYLSLFALSVIVNLYVNQSVTTPTILEKIVSVSALPWLYMFMLGQLAHAYWDRISRFVTDRFFTWILLYAGAIMLSTMLETQIELKYWGNAVLPLNVLVLSGLVLSMVVTKPHLSERLLNGNDVSYGIYIYHGPIINALIVTQLTKSWIVLVLTTIVAAFICGALSWYLVERPFLRLKTSTIHRR